MISTIGEEENTSLDQGMQGQRHVSMTANVSFSNSTGIHPAKIIVRTEEVVIVTLVLVLWVAAIALFFNRWGKIRMLEPYQPKFIQQHRPSCPLVDPIQHRSFSKFNINADIRPAHSLRPRQNSVFVGSSIMTLPINPPRKAKSAFDLQNLILSDPALNRSVIKLNLNGSDLRRSSLRTHLGINTEASHSKSIGSERRLSFKDLVEESAHLERVQCCIEREPTDGELSKRGKKQGKTISKEYSMSESRHNSITSQDPKVILATKGDRRSSLMPTHKDADEHRSGVSNFRRNSAMFINSLDADRNYLLPRSDNIKSGVIDFRRNSMLIVNNLNEDMGLLRPFTRNMSLGGSNMNLVPDFPIVRRSSVIPPFCHEHKPKVTIPHVSIVKAKPPLNMKSPSLNHTTDSKFLINQKASRSLDSGESSKTMWKQAKRETSPESSKHFLTPGNVQKSIGSTASLNAEQIRLEDRKHTDESRSMGNLTLDKTEFHSPLIVETKCTSDGEKSEEPSTSRSNLLRTEDREDSWKAVNLTTSLSNINITSAIPLNVITSSGVTKKTNPVDMSHAYGCSPLHESSLPEETDVNCQEDHYFHDMSFMIQQQEM